MEPAGLANTRISTGYAQKSPRSLTSSKPSPSSYDMHYPDPITTQRQHLHNTSIPCMTLGQSQQENGRTVRLCLLL